MFNLNYLLWFQISKSNGKNVRKHEIVWYETDSCIYSFSAPPSGSLLSRCLSRFLSRDLTVAKTATATVVSRLLVCGFTLLVIRQKETVSGKCNAIKFLARIVSLCEHTKLFDLSMAGCMTEALCLHATNLSHSEHWALTHLERFPNELIRF